MRGAKAALAALPLIACAFAAHAATFEDGMSALEDKDFQGAIAVFGPLAAKGNGDAQFMLGVMHENGLGLEKNLSAAASWYLKAAEAGIASAQYNIGVFYQLGTGVAADPREALKWHSRAADQGHHRAHNKLATMYYTRVSVVRDTVEAWKWLTLAAAGLKGEAHDITRKNIATIEGEMAAGDLAEAKRRVAEWQARR